MVNDILNIPTGGVKKIVFITVMKLGLFITNFTIHSFVMSNDAAAVAKTCLM